MTWEAVGALSGLVSSVAAVLALIAVFYALRQWQESQRQTVLLTNANMATVYQHVAAMMLEINRYFLEHPEWKPYFYDGEEVPGRMDKREREQIETLAEMFADFIDLISVLEQTTESHSATARRHWAEWYTYVESVVETSPCLREFVSRRESWYDQKMRVLVSSPTASGDAQSAAGG